MVYNMANKMAGIEQEKKQELQNVIEILARVGAGHIKMEDVDESYQHLLGSYIEMLSSDQDFREKVTIRKNEIIVNDENIKRFPLFPEEELIKAKKHKKTKTTSNNPVYNQSFLFEYPEENNVDISDVGLDPERNIGKMHQVMQKRFDYDRKQVIGAELRHKKDNLRELIGLPFVRGKKDVRANDPFYRFLVNRIIKKDTLGIVSEFTGSVAEFPTELEGKIEQIRNFVGTIVNSDLSQREKYRAFDRFFWTYNKEK